MSIILSAWTVIVLVVFIGITIWAFSSKNKDSFESAAHIPFDQEDEIPLHEEDNKHG